MIFKPKPDASASPLSEIEAVVGIAILAINADGVLAPDEEEDLQVMLARMRLFRRTKEGSLSRTVSKMRGLAIEHREEKLLALCVDAIPERLRPTAYLAAADLCVADESFVMDEESFLVRLQKSLGLDDATAEKICEVVAIRHAE